MKTLLISLTAGTVVAVSGCWPQYLVQPTPPEPVQPVADVRPRPSRPPVTAEQVTSSNAHQLAEALREEIDREQGRVER